MAQCPLCNGKLKKVEAMVFCENYKPVKTQNGDWINEGTCEFRIMFKNKIFGTLTGDDIKKMLSGGFAENKKGDKIFLDTENKTFFTKIEFAPKEEPEDF